MAPINEREDDLVMESTTDSAEQIAEGLGLELAPIDPNAEPAPEPESIPDATGDEGGEPAPPVVEPPAGQISVEPKRAGASKKTKRVSPAVAAATKAAEDLRLENETLKQRLAEAATKPAPVAAGSPPAVTRPVAAQPTPVATPPGQHPDLADIETRRTALGAKPAQDNFDDYDKFIEEKDTWLRKQGALDAEESIVRRSVTREQQAEQARAQQDAQTILATFQQRRDAARKAHPDFDTAMDAATEIAVQPHVGDAIIHSEQGGELVYHFAKNPAELQRIQALSPTAAVMEVGAIARQLSTPARKGPPPRVTKAPEPQGTQLGNDPSGGSQPDLDDPNLTLAQYNRLRDRMDMESGRRPH